MNNVTSSTGILVAFHIGRGGSFHNQGFKSYIGEHNIDHFVGDLFLKWSNRIDVEAQISNDYSHNELESERLINLLYESYTDINLVKELNDLGYNLGELEYFDECDNSVGLTATEAATGIGKIDIDGDYDTTYVKDISECNKQELMLIVNSDICKSNELEKYIERTYPELIEVEEEE